MSDSVLLGLVVVAAFLTILSYVIASFGLTLLFGAPYVGTPPSVARRMLQLADVRPGEVFVDLGSGSGTMILLAVKEFGAQKAIGYEINPILVLWTRWRIWKNGLRGRVEVRRANFFTCELVSADVIGLYLLDQTMDRLLPRVRENLRAGGRVVSRGFTFRSLQPASSLEGPSGYLHLYRL